MNNTHNNKSEPKNYLKFILLAAIPAVLCALLSLGYIVAGGDGAMLVWILQLFLTWFICPAYFTVLYWRHTVKKDLGWTVCMAICLSMNALASLPNFITLSAVGKAFKIIKNIIYALPFFIFPMAVLLIGLLVVWIMRRHEKQRRD
ncbi:MAG: hypothetical protein FWE85_04165 [Clostridiales bacterium]|nr:hypothetical protein [Clostridiales bacterium]